MPLHRVIDLAEQGDKNALLARKTFGAKYDDYYMQRAPTDDEDNEDEESIVIDEDAAGRRTTANVLCLSIGFLGVRALPTECDVIIVNNELYIAGWDEYSNKYTPL